MAEDLKKEFSMTYGNLLEVCDNVHNSMTRDIDSMGIFGVTPLKLSAFKTQIDEFLAFPDDSSLVNEMMIATQNRNELASNLKIFVRTFGVRAKIAFHNNQGKMDSFLLSDLSHASDSDLLFFCEKVAVKSVEYLSELSPLGGTQEVIDELTNKMAEFRTARIAQEDAVQNRDDSAHLRMQKANELYRSLVNYSEIGKNVWYEVNEALYNDYLIYDYTGSNSTGSGGTLPAAPENLSVDVNTMIFSWSSVPNTQNYTLEKSAVGIEWEIIYTGPDNFFMYVPETEGINLYRVKGSNSIGSGLYSSMMSYNYLGLPAPDYVSIAVTNAVTGEVALNWGEVPLSTFYKLFVSSVALGAEAGEYVLVGQYAVASYTGIFALSQRHFFKVIAGNLDDESIASDSVYVEL